MLRVASATLVWNLAVPEVPDAHDPKRNRPRSRFLLRRLGTKLKNAVLGTSSFLRTFRYRD